MEYYYFTGPDGSGKSIVSSPQPFHRLMIDPPKFCEYASGLKQQKNSVIAQMDPSGVIPPKY